jgi:hypothetical protein
MIIIPMRIKVEAGQLQGKSFVRQVALDNGCAEPEFVQIVWTAYQQKKYARYLLKLANAPELRKAGLEFMIDDKSAAEVWDAGKNFKRWQKLESRNSRRGKRRKNDPAKRQAPSAPTERN